MNELFNDRRKHIVIHLQKVNIYPMPERQNTKSTGEGDWFI